MSATRPLRTSRSFLFEDTLFALLGDAYELNVFEAHSTLCPSALCPDDGMPRSRGRPLTLFADVAVVYLHVVTPATMARRLPSLEARWKGFVTLPFDTRPMAFPFT